MSIEACLLVNWIWDRYGKDIADKSLSLLQEQWRRFQWEEAARSYRARMQEQHSSVRVLGNPKTILLEEVYSEAYVLDRPTAVHRHSLEQLQKHLERSGELQPPGDRLNALRIAIQRDRLFVLGKPGAGKTTFLRYLVLKAVEGRIQKVPIFVSLKEWSDSHLELMTFITNEFEICSFPNPEGFIEHILKRGDALVLFDGLDEVSPDAQTKNKQVSELSRFVRRYPNNQYAITCRLATLDYLFDRFTYVEMADFNDRQIQAFAHKWFGSSHTKCATFLAELSQPENRGILDLARTPLLLTLLCLAYDETLAFPRRQVELYREAVDALFSKWDSSRNIQRETPQRGLSLGRKRQMLGRIAIAAFERKQYFFRQEELTRQIDAYLAGLPPADRVDPEMDGATVLKAIEQRHGLLVERAHGIYSFSHLTFHEYFAATFLVDNSANGALQQLIADHVGDERWHEVFLFVVSSLDSADFFLDLYRQTLTAQVRQDGVLTHLLNKAGRVLGSSVRAQHDPVAALASTLATDVLFAALGPGPGLVEGIAALSECLRVRLEPAVPRYVHDFLTIAHGLEQALQMSRDLLGRWARLESNIRIAAKSVRLAQSVAARGAYHDTIVLLANRLDELDTLIPGIQSQLTHLTQLLESDLSQADQESKRLARTRSTSRRKVARPEWQSQDDQSALVARLLADARSVDAICDRVARQAGVPNEVLQPEDFDHLDRYVAAVVTLLACLDLAYVADRPRQALAVFTVQTIG